MNAYVEECRREWRRLGVPDLLAEEMATELEADLAEAEADGVAASEVLGESDPRRFAATWARERGLVSEPPPKKSRKGLWIGIAVGLVLLFIALPALALITLQSGSITTAKSQPPIQSLVLPNFVGLKACRAQRIALEAGLNVRKIRRPRCNAVVVAQRPARGTLIPYRQRKRTTLKLRLRG
jgi:hypothetical protein